MALLIFRQMKCTVTEHRIQSSIILLLFTNINSVNAVTSVWKNF